MLARWQLLSRMLAIDDIAQHRQAPGKIVQVEHVRCIRQHGHLQVAQSCVAVSDDHQSISRTPLFGDGALHARARVLVNVAHKARATLRAVLGGHPSRNDLEGFCRVGAAVTNIAAVQANRRRCRLMLMGRSSHRQLCFHARAHTKGAVSHGTGAMGEPDGLQHVKDRRATPIGHRRGQLALGTHSSSDEIQR